MKGKVSTQSEEYLIGLIVTCILFKAVDEEINIALVLGGSPGKVLLHIGRILLIDPHVDATTTMVHLMGDMREDTLLGTFLRALRSLKKRFPNKFKFLSLLSCIFF